MSKGWTKLDSGIVDSTLWAKDHETLRVWIALLAKCDAGGYARVAVPMMAQLCQMTIPRFQEIIADLSSPDEFSRCQDQEGRRVQAVEGGYIVLSYERYRSMRTRALTDAERKRRQRERETADKLIAEATSHDGHESHDVTPEAEAEAEAYTEAETTGTARPTGKPSNTAPAGFDDFWAAYPKKSAKKDARKAWRTTAKGRPPVADLIAAIEARKATRQWREGIVPLPATWLRGERWTDEIEASADDIDTEIEKAMQEMTFRGDFR